jgi:hypothetical protein
MRDRISKVFLLFFGLVVCVGIILVFLAALEQQDCINACKTAGFDHGRVESSNSDGLECVCMVEVEAIEIP